MICPVPQLELDFIEPLDGVRTMLELGNKANGAGTYKAYFESRGIAHTSVDINGQDGALPLDLRKPLGLGLFDIVTNIGTTEHVDQQEPVWRNIAEAARALFVSATPVPGDWKGHGLFYPPAAFYDDFARLNGFRIERMQIAGPAPRRCIYVRMARTVMRPFAMPLVPIPRNG
jgi:hypothetical protein